MTRRLFLAGLAGLGLALGASLALPGHAADATPAVGGPAPAFHAVDSKGAWHRLEDYRGRIVVLEWTNDGCPYVGKHYGAGAMQALQREAAEAGVVWLSVISSAPGQQGHVDGAQADALTESRHAAPAAVLLDPEGTMGRAYDARTTPHMYVIDAAGTLVYMGGIDDRPSADRASLEGAHNYVRAALADLAAGRPVAEAVTRPYGCTVKYGS